MTFNVFLWYSEELKYLNSHFSKEKMKTDEKYSKKSLKVKQKVEKAALLGLFCESKKLVGK